jgi:hypothetical protein
MTTESPLQAPDRPPWNQAWTLGESDEIVRLANEAGGDLRHWLLNGLFIVRALEHESDRFKRALIEIIGEKRCSVIHGNKPKGWTCLDYLYHAELWPERYAEPYGASLRMGQRLCHICVARRALGEPFDAPHPKFDKEYPSA